MVSSCMLPRGSPPCVTSYSHSPRSAAGAADHGAYVGFPSQQNQFGHVSLNNFFSADSLLTPAANSHPAFETKPEFERRSSSIAVLRMKAKEHTANISWAMWSGFLKSYRKLAVCPTQWRSNHICCQPQTAVYNHMKLWLKCYLLSQEMCQDLQQWVI